eukprot:CAMPEP_0167819460 /NCGR_PEP_ID=MMETSP0112_2-20121227/5409_1 /TAXON_ID=91324 /ORGANISM="Lotharella globosa, Strain CCCM811" /LENGTH=72 /DNA_ID=CAMNT_0007719631 /DNA_START=268 /DNA_END=486 /DNA_ORIENTATION=-
MPKPSQVPRVGLFNLMICLPEYAESLVPAKCIALCPEKSQGLARHSDSLLHGGNVISHDYSPYPSFGREENT